jgi:4-aminobutyrate aminotransferase-like enzyme
MSDFQFKKTPQKVNNIETKFRRIKGSFPHPESIQILEDLAKYESRSMHGQMPVVWDRAIDYQVFDAWGNIWIDFTSTIFVANSGHANPHIKKALQDTINKDLLHTYNYPSKIRSQFLKKLVEVSPSYLNKAYLMSTGTEATECLIKLIRMHGKIIGKRKPGVVSFLGAYHGRTMGAAQIGGTVQSQEWIGYKDPNIHQVPFPYEWDLQGRDHKEVFYDHLNLLKVKGVNPETDICGFVLESYIGWSAGFIPEGYIKELASFCVQHSILLSFDEVQGGFGRTGKTFVFEHYGVQPDLIACGKGISSSLPLSPVVGRGDILDLPDVGSMSSTHSANPLSCAAGLANLEVLFDKQVIKLSQAKGIFLHERLNVIKEKSLGYIKHVTGRGLLAALVFHNPQTNEPEKLLPSYICEKAMQSGLLLIHTGRESIKIAPPLTISIEALEEGLDALASAILECITSFKDCCAS